MTRVISSTGGLRRERESEARAHKISLHKISEMLSTELAVLIEELKAESPPPDHAGHHDVRVMIVSRALDKIGGVVVRVSKAVGPRKPRLESRPLVWRSCSKYFCHIWDSDVMMRQIE